MYEYLLYIGTAPVQIDPLQNDAEDSQDNKGGALRDGAPGPSRFGAETIDSVQFINK
jgi:hypothetical protein